MIRDRTKVNKHISSLKGDNSKYLLLNKNKNTTLGVLTNLFHPHSKQYTIFISY